MYRISIQQIPCACSLSWDLPDGMLNPSVCRRYVREQEMEATFAIVAESATRQAAFNDRMETTVEETKTFRQNTVVRMDNLDRELKNLPSTIIINSDQVRHAEKQRTRLPRGFLRHDCHIMRLGLMLREFMLTRMLGPGRGPLSSLPLVPTHPAHAFMSLTAQVLLDKPASLKHGVRQLTVRDVAKELKSTVEQHDVDINALKKDCKRYEEELQGVRLPCIGSRVEGSP